jgi:predicted DNA-binding ribbon-helix-helix protein
MKPLKHSFTIAGHKTSISLEPPFWEALKEAAKSEGVSLAALIKRIDKERSGAGLSSAVRIWVLDYFRTRAVSSPASRF